jgi:hypothetical protein
MEDKVFRQIVYDVVLEYKVSFPEIIIINIYRLKGSNITLHNLANIK